jgi:hypothetical protein
VLGGLIFLVLGGPSGKASDDVIAIDPALRERLSTLYHAQLGAYPSPEEMKGLVKRHVRDEMLYREALRLGLDKDDEIVRRRLIQKMEFLVQREAGAVPEQDLRDYYAAHKDQFGTPARASFRQLYFDPDTEGWDAAKARAEAALAAGKTASADRSPLQGEYASLGPQDAVQLFGDSRFTDALYVAPVGRWSGPYRSGLGWHLLFVTAREKAELPPFEQVADAVRRSYAETQRDDQLAATLADLSKRYTVKEVAAP